MPRVVVAIFGDFWRRDLGVKILRSTMSADTIASVEVCFMKADYADAVQVPVLLSDSEYDEPPSYEDVMEMAKGE